MAAYAGHAWCYVNACKFGPTGHAKHPFLYLALVQTALAGVWIQFGHGRVLGNVIQSFYTLFLSRFFWHGVKRGKHVGKDSTLNGENLSMQTNVWANRRSLCWAVGPGRNNSRACDKWRDLGGPEISAVHSPQTMTCYLYEPLRITMGVFSLQLLAVEFLIIGFDGQKESFGQHLPEVKHDRPRHTTSWPLKPPILVGSCIAWYCWFRYPGNSRHSYGTTIQPVMLLDAASSTLGVPAHSGRKSHMKSRRN